MRYPNKKLLGDIWLNEFVSKGHCGLCGNHGIIDTTGKVFTPAGYECGGRFFCICPNGRSMKAYEDKEAKKKGAEAPR